MKLSRRRALELAMAMPVLISQARAADMAPGTSRVYPGADGSFELYEDEGDNYAYEEGAFSLIPMTWNDGDKVLVLGDRQGA